MPEKSATETQVALQHFVGRDKAQLLYSDGALELETAAKNLGYPKTFRPRNGHRTMAWRSVPFAE